MASYSVFKILSSTIASATISSQSNLKSKTNPHALPHLWLGHGLTTTISYPILSLHHSNPCQLHEKPTKISTATSSTVVSSLPTAYPERAISSEKVPKWSWRAIKSFTMGELEARKLRSPNTGTEALLMGILKEGTSLASKFLRADGVTLLKVHEEAVNLHGKSDMFFFSPEHPPLTAVAQRALDWAFDHKLKFGKFIDNWLLLSIVSGWMRCSKNSFPIRRTSSRGSSS